MENFIEIHDDFIKIREATKKGFAVAKYGDSINLEQPNSKTRRGRVGKQIANTLTCSCNQGVVVKEEIYINKVTRIGQVSSIGSQAGMVYLDTGLFPTVCACTHGYAIGNILETNNINNKERGNYMWKNELENFNFKMDKIKLVSLFSGIGAFEEALNVLGTPVKIKHFAEVDVDAIIDYAAIHIPNFLKLDFHYPSDDEMREWLMSRNIGWDFEKGKSKIPRLKKDKLYKVYKASVLGENLGDVSLIKYDNFEEVDMIVGGSPCQDFSVAGKQKGSIWTCKECGHQYNPIEQHWSKRDKCPKCESKELDKTRSSLLVEYLRAVRELKPKYFVYENVKNIKGKGFIKIFNLFEEELKEYGYNVYNKVINAKNNGIPQNRERVFVVGIRNDVECEFDFIEDFNNGVRLKDVLEEKVEEKYYINTERAEMLVEKLNNEGYLNKKIVPCDSTLMKPKSLDIANCITARYDAGIQNKQSIGVAIAERLGGLFDDKTKHQAGSVWNTAKLAPTLDTMQGGYRQPCVENNYRIRKLTPLECWRLMGFRDESFYKALEMNTSNSALYKQAGNSIVVNCLYYIFKEVFKKYIVNKEDNIYSK